MLSAALLLFANTLLFSLRLSGGGSFPKPLSAAEEREYLRRYAQGDQEGRTVMVISRSPAGPPFLPALPCPRMEMVCPLSMPAGMLA